MAEKHGDGKRRLGRRKKWLDELSIPYVGQMRRNVRTLLRRPGGVLRRARPGDRRPGWRDGLRCRQATCRIYLQKIASDSVKGTVKEPTYANYSLSPPTRLPALGHIKLKNLFPAACASF